MPMINMTRLAEPTDGSLMADQHLDNQIAEKNRNMRMGSLQHALKPEQGLAAM